MRDPSVVPKTGLPLVPRYEVSRVSPGFRQITLDHPSLSVTRVTTNFLLPAIFRRFYQPSQIRFVPNEEVDAIYVQYSTSP